jgi:hypothetical protein
LALFIALFRTAITMLACVLPRFYPGFKVEQLRHLKDPSDSQYG